MKLLVRIPKNNLTAGGRTMYGMSISHDGVCHAMKGMIEDCFMEYPSGDATDAVSQTPESLEDYMVMWYGDPTGWDMAASGHGHGTVGYTRCGEVLLPDTMKEPMNQCDAMFVASTAAQASFSEQLDVPVHVLSGGVKPELFPLLDRDFNSSPFVFLHAGSTDWRKGSDRACEAFALAFDGIEDVQLLVMSPGETPMFSELKKQYAEDERYVFEVNPVADRSQVAHEYYGRAHCLVYPSIMEGWGRCLAEAMFTGMPVICFYGSAMLDQFSGVCGWWIAAGDETEGIYPLPSVEAMAAQMLKAYMDRRSCEFAGSMGHYYAIDNLTWEAGLKTALPVLENIYNAN